MKPLAGTAVVLLAVALTACIAETEPLPVPEPPPAVAPMTPQPEVPPEQRIADPKDAHGIAPCDLLTDRQLAALGLLPESGAPTQTAVADGCGWQFADDPLNLAAAGVQVDKESPTLARVYDRGLGGARFQPVEDISGHPAARASTNANNCILMVAIAGDQILGIFPNIAERPLPDPCALPRRMAELILSNLPPQG